MHFGAPPQVKFVPDQELPLGRNKVQAHSSLKLMNETMTLSLDRSETGELLPADAFLIVDGTNIFPLNRPVINIGRRDDNHLVIDDERVSRLHSQLRAVKGRYVIFDLGSTGGTFVNGVRQGHCPLYPGDVLSLAGVTLVYGQDPGFKSADTGVQSRSDDGETQPLTPFPKTE